MKIDFDQLRELLDIVSQTDISEISVESGDERITVKKSRSCSPIEVQSAGSAALQFQSTDLSAPVQSNPAAPLSGVQGTMAPSSSSPEATKSNLVEVTSPMVGTFYRSPAPAKPPFVEVGDVISAGQTVCIIEAMKLMNDLPSEVSGTIVDILAESGATVEYGQTLFLVDPEF